MDVIEFRIAVEDGEGKVTPGLTIHPVVNGVALRDLAKPVEHPFASAEGNPDQAGDYMGLVQVDWLRWPADHYLGEPRDTWFDDGDTTLLGCICGESGCWPLTAFVEVGSDVVTWRNFRNGHRDWDLSALGPFVFDRTQYETALRATTKEPDGSPREGSAHAKLACVVQIPLEAAQALPSRLHRPRGVSGRLRRAVQLLGLAWDGH